ncbi:uncharacterized protein LOC123700429 [Colias croceus]|uniref:uncharacterized protein LOC123700429 n=1 Tax=Colias crocea TaxID=72248 RepID=UPI001E27CEDD|nr:uncharacterized protein LOC123700429 [Colias croceus]
MRLRSRILPQAGTKVKNDGESRPGPTSPGCPSYSGGGNVSLIAQSHTVATQSIHDESSSCYSPPSSVISSVNSSPQSISSTQQFRSPHLSSTSSSQSIGDVAQEAISAKVTAPALDGRRTRKTWSREMNIFIMRHYFILTDLEINTKSYLTPLHARFILEFPDMAEVGKQRIGDQRRAIVQRGFLKNQEIHNIKEEVRALLQNTTASEQNNITDYTQSRRIRWTDKLNEEIMRSYYRLTKLETDLTTYRPLLHQDVISKCPSIAHLSVQRIADQRRSIVHNKLLSTDKLNTIREEIKNELSTTILQLSDENTTIDATQASYNYQTPQVTQTFTSEQIPATTQTTQDSLKLPSELTKQLEELFTDIYTRFKDSDPTKRPYIPKLKPSKKLSSTVNYINNEILPKLLKSDVDFNTIQTLIYSAAFTSAKFIGARIIEDEVTCSKQQRIPWWQRRLEGRIKDLRANIGRLNEYVKGVRKLSQPNNSHDSNCIPPTSESLQTYWSNIWSQPIEHRHNQWIDEDKEILNHVPDMEFEQIQIDLLKSVIERSHNWKATGTDNIHNFWYKKLTRTHELLLKHINTFIQSPNLLPYYITQGLTYMLPKDLSDSENPSKYRPITCLQNIYKIITACLSESIYKHIHEHNIMAEEQKGCRKNSQGCKEQLTIDSVASIQALRQKRSIYTMYIDYKKAFDSVPHSWLIYILKHYKINHTIIHFLENIMRNWNTKLKVHNSQKTTETDVISIKRGIFQGDSLSPLWFCLALNPLSHMLNRQRIGFEIKHNTQHTTLSHLMYMDDIKLFAGTSDDIHTLATITQNFSNDICMEFGINKCKIQSINKGVVEQAPYELPSHEIIDTVDPVEGYKYLGYTQSQEIHHKEIKKLLQQSFKNRLHKILHTQLNARNTIKAINTFAIPILTYSFGIIRWNQTELATLQRIINTTMTKHRKHHPRSCIQRLTLPKCEGGRGLIDIKNLYNKQLILLRTFFHKRSNQSPLHNAICQADSFTPLTLADHTKQINITSKQQKIDVWTTKSLHGRHRLDLTNPVVDKIASNAWLKRGELFPETEGFMLAIQDQVIDTKNYRKYIIRDSTSSDHCRHCHKQPETIQHITGACSSITQTDYKHRHDQVAAIVHQTLAYKHKLITEKTPYYKYTPQIILDSPDFKMYWDRTILTDKTVHHNRPDITLHDKKNKTIYLIDIAIPNTHNLSSTHTNKLSKYTDLSIELKTQWQVHTVKTIPIIISSTGVIPKTLHTSLKTLNLHPLTYALLQKAVILNTCRIVRKFLSID